MKKWENSLLYTRNDYEVQQKNSEMENNINLSSQKNMLIRISAMEETVRIRPIRISNVEKIEIHYWH